MLHSGQVFQMHLTILLLRAHIDHKSKVVHKLSNGRLELFLSNIIVLPM